MCIGRPYLYGLGARGPAGVAHVLNILREEVARTMTLMGVERLEDLNESWLIPAQQVIRNEFYPDNMTGVDARTGG